MKRDDDQINVELIEDLARSNSAVTVRRYSRGVVFFWLIAGIIVGIWMHGALTKPPPSRNTVTPTPTVTVTITKTVEVSVPTLPESCKRAVQIALDMDPNFKKIVSAGGTETDILKAARIAIASNDMAELGKAGTKNNQLQNDIAKATRDLSEQYASLQEALDECNKAIGR